MSMNCRICHHLSLCRWGAARCRFLLRLTAVAAETPRRGELTQPVADHVFSDEDLQMRLPVVDHECMADALGNDRASSRPSCDGLLHARLVLPLDLAVQLGVDERSFFQGSTHWNARCCLYAYIQPTHLGSVP